jgi:formylglycine-generating enzyme required for sulfatase activity
MQHTDVGQIANLPRFRQVRNLPHVADFLRRAILVALTALGSLAWATAQEVKKAGDKKQITNSIGMKLVLLPAGEFMMGSRQSTEELAKMFAKYESNPVWSGHEYVFTSPVGRFRANSFGLYDMHGNAMQWCADCYEAWYYGRSPANDPVGPDSGALRVLRGSAWVSWPSGNRSAFRCGSVPDTRTDFTGFRVARTSYPLEERAGLSGKPTTRMRPLGRHLMVDEHGIIWDGERPVGIWGVNGSPMLNAPVEGMRGGLGGRDGNRQLLAPPAR